MKIFFRSISIIAVFILNSTVISAPINANPEEKIDLVIESNKIFDPNKLSIDSLQMFEKNFHVDSRNIEKVGKDKTKIEEIESFLVTTKLEELKKLKQDDQRAFGRLLYKLGDFYTYILRSPQLAIDKMILANNFLHNKEDKAKIYNQLGYLYELKFSKSKQDADKSPALFYADQVINKFYPHNKNNEVAFAYVIKGLIERDQKNFGNAEKYLQEALQLYKNKVDEQYIITQNRLAEVILAMNDRDQEALKILEDLKSYWQKKQITLNYFVAKTCLVLGEAYLKLNYGTEAKTELEHAVQIFQTIFGEQSDLLIKPYQLLSSVYNRLGERKRAQFFNKKAQSLMH